MHITIKNHTISAVIDTIGAQLVSLKDANQKEYIWQRDSHFWSKSSPLLFPSIGNSRENKTLFEGQWYPMPKHGFCKELPFQIKNYMENTAAFTITDTPATKMMYPYKFRLTLTYTVVDSALWIDYTVENKNPKEMFYCIGAHPGFYCPLYQNEHFEEYYLEFEKEESISSLIYDITKQEFDASSKGITLNQTKYLPLSYDMFDQDAVFFKNLCSRKVSLLHTQTKKGLSILFPDFQSIAFWTPAHVQAPFLCIEPWNGSAICSDEDDEFTHKHHVQSLPVGKNRTYHLEIQLL